MYNNKIWKYSPDNDIFFSKYQNIFIEKLKNNLGIQEKAPDFSPFSHYNLSGPTDKYSKDEKKESCI